MQVDSIWYGQRSDCLKSLFGTEEFMKVSLMVRAEEL
jgi:hypothetical protein